ncbi:MAG: hypothetical protein DRO39_02785 [Thermoprotei archaeon]|nr:MAG: hypothetical protein DRO39_02785 [Thermoprotei archaeon]
MLRGVAEYWGRLPTAAKRYIVLQALSTPILFVWLLIPYLMLVAGLDVGEAGAVLTIASAIAAGVNAVVGMALDRAEPVAFISLIFIVEGVAYLVYMYGFLAGVLLLIVAAAVVERLARGFYPVFAVYEYDVYPEEIREKAFALHNLVPYLAQLASYPLIGYVLAVALSSTKAQILSLGVFAASSTALGVLAALWLPRIGARRLELSQPLLPRTVPRAFLRMAMAVIVFGIGFELCQPLIVANLFIEIARNPLLGLALYETFAAIPVVLVSPAILSMGRERGASMVALGMGLVAVADLLLGFSQRVETALLAALVASAGYAAMDPFFMDVLFASIPEEHRGALLGFLATARRLVGMAMPVVAGLVAEANPRLPFILAAAAVAISMALTLSIAKQRYTKAREPRRKP